MALKLSGKMSWSLAYLTSVSELPFVLVLVCFSTLYVYTYNTYVSCRTAVWVSVLHNSQVNCLSCFSDDCRSIFAARCYASAAYVVTQCPSVRPSVCLSRLWIMSKRINISSQIFHRRVATPF